MYSVPTVMYSVPIVMQTA